MEGRLVELGMVLENGELGNRVFCSVVFNESHSSRFILLPVAYTGTKENEFEWSGKRVNVVFKSAGTSGKNFGYGYAGVACTKDGILRFAGRLADDTAWSGVARVVKNETGEIALPLAVTLPNGILHGEADIHVNPQEGETHFSSSSPWIWLRTANAKAKSFAAGFEEELDVFGQVWTWTKGTSALGGSSANFTLSLSPPIGVSMPVGVSTRTGTLAASNKPVWNSLLPKGFSIKIKPSTGAVTGKVPATQGGKSVLLPYQGILFSDSLDIGSQRPVTGAGLVSGNGSSGTMEITVP